MLSSLWVDKNYTLIYQNQTIWKWFLTFRYRVHKKVPLSWNNTWTNKARTVKQVQSILNTIYSKTIMCYHISMTAVPLVVKFRCYRPYLENYEKWKNKVNYKSVEYLWFSAKIFFTFRNSFIISPQMLFLLKSDYWFKYIINCL